MHWCLGVSGGLVIALLEVYLFNCTLKCQLLFKGRSSLVLWLKSQDQALNDFLDRDLLGLIDVTIVQG